MAMCGGRHLEHRGCLRSRFGLRALLTLMIALLLAQMPPGVARAQDLSWQVWGAVMTDNDVRQLVTFDSIRLLESGLVGFALNTRFGRPYDVPFGQLRFEAEAQLVRHFGLQDHWEVNLPVGLRFAPRRRVLGFDSLAFLVGPSMASQIPAIELRRGGGVGSRGMVYFHVELERQLRSDPAARIFLRLHHRSGGYGLFANAVGTNALAIGYRRAF